MLICFFFLLIFKGGQIPPLAPLPPADARASIVPFFISKVVFEFVIAHPELIRRERHLFLFFIYIRGVETRTTAARGIVSVYRFPFVEISKFRSSKFIRSSLLPFYLSPLLFSERKRGGRGRGGASCTILARSIAIAGALHLLVRV